MFDPIFSKWIWGVAFLPGVVLALYGRWRFGRAYRRFSTVASHGNLSGARAARVLLDRVGMANVELYETSEFLSDHYDPRRRCVFLSEKVADNATVASVAIAAHVVAHGSQFRQDHRFFRLRMVMMRFTGLFTNTSLLLILAGWLELVDSPQNLLIAGAGLYTVFILLQLFTLPVEYEASRVAQKELTRHQLIDASEEKAFDNMLGAAVWIDMPHLLAAPFGLGRLFSRKEKSDDE